MIRDFAWADYPAVLALWQGTARDPLTEEELRATIDHGPGLMLVGEDLQAGVVGVVLGTFDGRRGWIHRLAVHPAYRRNGLATGLISRLEDRLTARGARRINLLVMPENAEGLAFWQQVGYLPRPDVLCSKPV